MRTFNFPLWLINKYSTTFTWIGQMGGYFDTETGKWHEGQSIEQEVNGVVVPYPETTQYQSGGTYLASDRQIYTLTKMPNKAKIRYQGKLYTITDNTPYPEYAQCYIYTAREVDAFSEEA
ncbi:MAG TPA: hypothetical protein DCW90_18725 [Lachnospiraceae bacterium]|nr:hypothetical protein [Lachnospiraceae bacterium]